MSENGDSFAQSGEEEEAPTKIPLFNYQNGKTLHDTLHAKADRPMGCTASSCKGSMFYQWKVQNTQAKFLSLENFNLAECFLREFYQETNRENEFLYRWEQVLSQLNKTGSYELTTEELEFGAKLAWRNHTRCVARIQWNNLVLYDHRDTVTNTDQMFKAICNFIKQTTNDGFIQPSLGVFPQRQYGRHDFRVWNKFMLAYAGYVKEELVPNSDGPGLKKKITKIGDQGNLEFTQFCQKLGWKGKGTHFDVLPVVISDDGHPKFYEIPEELILTVPIKHPVLKAIDDLKFQWYGLPSVAGMMLEVGGLQFPASPFGGWYCSTEIVRDILEPNRYDLMEPIAKALGLDTSSHNNLWRDRVAIEVNTAVLHSFKVAGVSIVDQHSVSEQFQTHLEEEYKTRGGCPSDWLWINPSQSGSLTPLFHQEMLHYHLSPSFESQDVLWQNYCFPDDGKKRSFSLKSVSQAIRFAVRLLRKKTASRPNIYIYYATETGSSKRYAEKLKQKLANAFNVTIYQMNEFGNHQSGICLFVTSTFGNGDPPRMAEKTAEWIDKKMTLSELMMNEEIGIGRPAVELNGSSGKPAPKQSGKTLFRRMTMTSASFDLKNLSFAVFALGSTAYPKYCAFGKWLDLALKRLDGNRLVPIGFGDELGDRDGQFNKWAKAVYQKACLEAGLQVEKQKKNIHGDSKVARWRVLPNERTKGTPEDISKDLAVEHRNDVVSTTLIGKNILPSLQCRSVLLNFEIQSSNPPVYQPGDHMAAFPVNQASDVDFLLKHLTGLPEDPKQTVIQLQEYKDGVGWDSTSTGLPITTLYDLFKYHLCLRSVPSMEVLEFLSRRAGNPIEKVELIKLASDYNAYNTWRQGWPGIIDLFQQFPSIQVDSADLASRLPLLQPRFYSIASSYDYSQKGGNSGSTFVDLLVHVVDYEGPDGATKRGFCSSFLHDLNVGDKISCYLRTAQNFHLPSDPSSEIPLIFVAAGCGIAPFRSFWQQKVFELEMHNKTNPIHLFFGCKDISADFLRDETDPLEGEILIRHSAYSRMDNMPKEYVQDVVRKHGKEIFTDIILKQGRIYVCGKVTMAEEVNAELAKIISKFGKLDEKRSGALLNRMKDEGRYCEDIFGQ